MTGETPKTRYELTVDLVKALAWPLFAFFILFSFWRPLHAAADQIPDIVSKSDTITIASLTLKIDRSLELQGQQPSQEVKQVLAQLTPDGLRRLMNMSGSSYYSTGSEDYAKTDNLELIKLGLLEEISDEELKAREKDYVYGVRLTSFGKETQEFLLALIAQFAQELAQPSK